MPLLVGVEQKCFEYRAWIFWNWCWIIWLPTLCVNTVVQEKLTYCVYNEKNFLKTCLCPRLLSSIWMSVQARLITVTNIPYFVTKSWWYCSRTALFIVFVYFWFLCKLSQNFSCSFFYSLFSLFLSEIVWPHHFVYILD